ncbi:MAG: hypothetical protein R3F19_28110 [Verrucomicrobiales bacterium]
MIDYQLHQPNGLVAQVLANQSIPSGCLVAFVEKPDPEAVAQVRVARRLSTNRSTSRTRQTSDTAEDGFLKKCLSPAHLATANLRD